MSATLRYVPDVSVDALGLGECTVHRASDGDDRWWLLWFRVNREDNGLPIDVAVAINPGGSFSAAGPGGKTWGLTRVAVGTWQVSPSIDVLPDQVHLGPSGGASMWHQTPSIVDVPDGEVWISGAP